MRDQKKILIVDDDEEILDVIIRVIEGSGYIPITASCGEEGVIQLQRNHDEIAAIILDFIMPGQSPEQTHDALREIDPELPIIYSTSQPQAEVSECIGLDNKTSYLQKPYLPGELIRELTRVIQESNTENA